MGNRSDCAKFMNRAGPDPGDTLYPRLAVFAMDLSRDLERVVKRGFDSTASVILLMATFLSCWLRLSAYSSKMVRLSLSAGKGGERGRNVYGPEVSQHEK